MNSSRFSSFLNWQVRVGYLFGIPIFLHITLVFFLLPALSSGGLGFWNSVEFSVLIVLSILLHELGHALTAKHFRLTRLSITLHGFGGFASSSGWGSPCQDLLITLAGPAVTFAVGLVCLFLGNFGLNHFGFGGAAFFQALIIKDVGYLNILLGFLNLLPMLPLDGGRAVQAILTFKMPEFKAMRATAHLGLVLAPILIVYGFFTKHDYFTLFGLMGLITCLMTLLNSGGIKFGEVFADRQVRKDDEAARQRSRAKSDAFVSEVNARQREREEKERLRKLFEASGFDEE